MEEKETLHIFLRSFKRDVSHLGHMIVLRMNQHHAVKSRLSSSKSLMQALIGVSYLRKLNARTENWLLSIISAC